MSGAVPGQPRCFDFEGVAPIPVGHRVEVSVYEHPIKGREQWVMVLDLVTGVLYGPSGLFADERRVVTRGPKPHTLRQDAPPIVRLRGQVQGARVLWRFDHKSEPDQLRTTLWVLPEVTP